MPSCNPAGNQAAVIDRPPDALDLKGLRVMCLASLQHVAADLYWTESMRDAVTHGQRGGSRALRFLTRQGE